MLKFIRSTILLLILGFIAVMLYRISGQLEPRLDIDESRATVIHKLQSLSNIETARMSLNKIIEGKQGVTDYLPGFERDDTVSDLFFKDVTRMEIYGDVVAGFDLKNFSGAAVIQHADQSISIRLPQASILSTSLTEQTRVYDKELGLFTKGEKDTETKMRNRAIQILRAAALSGGILEQAEDNALDTMRDLFGDEVDMREITFE